MALQRLQLEDGTVIWLEASDESFPIEALQSTETTRGSRDATSSSRALQQLASMQDTIKAFTHYTLNAFRQVANANVNKVTLEFGINVGGEAGIPYITKGSIGSNIKVTVECTFPNNPSA
jgi:hypothetical protein